MIYNINNQNIMTLNCPINQQGHPFAVPGEAFILFRRDIDFSVKIQKVGKKSGVGTGYLTTFRIIFVPKTITPQFQSFDLPIANLINQQVQFPLFGATYLHGICKPYQNMLPANCRFKLVFKNGGCDTFIKILSLLIKQTRKRMGQQMSFQQSVMYHDIRAGRMNFNAFMNPNDPSRIYVSQPVLPLQKKDQFSSAINQQKIGQISNKDTKITNNLHCIRNEPKLVKNNTCSSQSQHKQPQHKQPQHKQPQHKWPQHKQQPIVKQINIMEQQNKCWRVVGDNEHEQDAVQNEHEKLDQNQQVVVEQKQIVKNIQCSNLVPPTLYPEQKKILITDTLKVESSQYYPQICTFAYFINRAFKLSKMGSHYSRSSADGYIPMNPNTFFTALHDGTVFCQFINITHAVSPKNNKSSQLPISPLAINHKPHLNQEKKIQNVNMAIDTAKSLGSYLIGITAQKIADGDHQNILSFTWQIIQNYISRYLTLNRYPAIAALKRQNETLQMLDKTHYKQILLRWINYHSIQFASVPDFKQIKSLNVDLIDCLAYARILSAINLIDYETVSSSQSGLQRGKMIINACKKYKIDTPIHYVDIVNSRQHFHIIFCFDLFCYDSGLNINSAVQADGNKDSAIKQNQVAQNIDNQQQCPQQQIKLSRTRQLQTLKSRQINLFDNWIRSLGVKSLTTTNDLLQTLKSGEVLLALIDHIRPGIVDWDHQVSTKYNSRIHIIQNCNYAIQLSTKNLAIKLVNVSGNDIVDKKTNLALGLVWQLCNTYWQQRVGKISNHELIEWANLKVPQKFRVNSLDDKHIATGIYILHLVESIKPGTVDFTKLKDNTIAQNIAININYSLSCVRKLGCQVLALWQHVKQTDIRFVRLIIAELMRFQQQQQI